MALLLHYMIHSMSRRECLVSLEGLTVFIYSQEIFTINRHQQMRIFATNTPSAYKIKVGMSLKLVLPASFLWYRELPYRYPRFAGRLLRHTPHRIITIPHPP
jgi:hypothetical protein